MPNFSGNPDFKPKYGEKTEVTRLPQSLAIAIPSLLKRGITSQDIIEALQPLSNENIFPDIDDDNVQLLKLPLQHRLLNAIKLAAKDEGIHPVEWIISQCRTALKGTLEIPEDTLNQLVDEKLSSVLSTLGQLTSQVTELTSRISALESAQPVSTSSAPTSKDEVTNQPEAEPNALIQSASDTVDATSVESNNEKQSTQPKTKKPKKLPSPLTQKALAERFGVSGTAIGRARLRGEDYFQSYCYNHDPKHYIWELDPNSQRTYQYICLGTLK